jgi:hypothetical protein
VGDPTNPTVRELRAFFALVRREVLTNRANGTTTPVGANPSPTQVATGRLIEAAFARGATAGEYYSRNNTGGYQQEVFPSNIQEYLPVAEMRKIVAQVFGPSSLSAVDDFDNAVRKFERGWDTIDPDSAKPNTNNIRASIADKADDLKRRIVDQRKDVGPRAYLVDVFDGNAGDVQKGSKGAKIDETYSAAGLTDFVAQTFVPLAQGTAAEQATATRISDKIVAAYERMVQRASDKPGPTQTPPFECTPLAYMQERFDTRGGARQTDASDIFNGI